MKCNMSFLFSSPKEVLLYIKMGVPGERSFYPPEELVWDASCDSSPHSLHTCLAARYGLSPDLLLLAKRQPEKWSWDEISNWVKTQNEQLYLILVLKNEEYTCLTFRTSRFPKRRKKRKLIHCWELHFTLKMVIQLGSRY